MDLLLWACWFKPMPGDGVCAIRSKFVKLVGESLPEEPEELSNRKLRIRVG